MNIQSAFHFLILLIPQFLNIRLYLKQQWKAYFSHVNRTVCIAKIQKISII